MGNGRIMARKAQLARMHWGVTVPATYGQRPSGFGWRWTAPPREIAPPTGAKVETQASVQKRFQEIELKPVQLGLKLFHNECLLVKLPNTG